MIPASGAGGRGFDSPNSPVIFASARCSTRRSALMTQPPSPRSSGMIPASGAGGRGFDSPNSPVIFASARCSTRRSALMTQPPSPRSSGMIPASGAGGRGFDSPNSPVIFASARCSTRRSALMTQPPSPRCSIWAGIRAHVNLRLKLKPATFLRFPHHPVSLLVGHGGAWIGAWSCASSNHMPRHLTDMLESTT